MEAGKGILAWLHAWLIQHYLLDGKPLRPEPVGRLCYACRRPLPVAGWIRAGDRDYCDDLCLPTYLRRKRSNHIGA